MRTLPLLVLAFILTACGGDKPAEQPVQRTKEEQRKIDSTVGATKLPGAGGVRGALAASDSMNARNKTLDSLAKTP